MFWFIIYIKRSISLFVVASENLSCSMLPIVSVNIASSCTLDDFSITESIGAGEGENNVTKGLEAGCGMLGAKNDGAGENNIFVEGAS
jgi:hypothetical protein